MKTELEVRRELREIRRLMAKERDRGQMPDSMNYGAQQALAWALGKASSPSELAALVDEVLEELEEEER